MSEEVSQEVEMQGKATRFKAKQVRIDCDVTDKDIESKTVTGSYTRTFGHGTLEVIPREHYYRQPDKLQSIFNRPTMDDLHNTNVETIHVKRQTNNTVTAIKNEVIEDVKSNKFGWIEGVLIRCLLNIWGVILFLRMSWIVGEAGIVASIGIVLLASVVTVLTTVSMSAICTNGIVEGGGAYFLLSRSLGPQFGGSIGVIFSLANAVAVSMYIVGFGETVRDLMRQHELVLIDFDNDVRIIGAITLVVLLGITQAGMAWESKAQGVLLVILLVAIGNYIVGVFIPKDFNSESFSDDWALPTENLTGRAAHLKKINSEGHFSLTSGIGAENIWPMFSAGQNFFTVFSIFFPAATGILAGSNISGDLKDPSAAIPKGTFAAIGITSAVYIFIIFLLGFHSTRYAPGFFGQMLVNGTIMPDDWTWPSTCSENEYSAAACQKGWNFTIIDKCPEPGIECRFGLKGDYATMAKVSGYEHLITAGIFAATLSSALACLVSAPKVFQALGKDNLIPKIEWFAKGYGPGNEPRRAYFLTFIISLAFILIGKLDAIAPIISNFFLASYALINYACFSASMANSPGFRPQFKYYNKWFALISSFLCVVIMFIANWWAALVTFVCVAALYKWIDHRDVDVNWGSTGPAYTYMRAMHHVQKLASVEDHIKNYRPQILCLSGEPAKRPHLVNLCTQMTRDSGICLLGHVCEKRADVFENTHQKKLDEADIKAIYTPIQAESVGQGAVALMSAAGIGKMRPNMVTLGFMYSWKQRDVADLYSYYAMVHDAFTLRMGVGILRLPDDSSAFTLEEQVGSTAAKSKSSYFDCCSASAEEKQALATPTPYFNGKVKPRTIDVYWLFDDGGLTILIPFLLTKRQFWSNAKLRIFTPGKEDRLDQDKLELSRLLTKLRIEAEVDVITDLNKPPSQEGRDKFDELIKPFKVDDSDDNEDSDHLITEDHLEKFMKKTERQIRINEIMKRNSSKADLIVCTLPIVKQKACPAPLYLSWLETISTSLPPCIMLRGNQESVLTYAS